MMPRVATRHALTNAGRARKGRRRVEMIMAIHEAGHAVAHRRLLPETWFSRGMGIVPEEEHEEEGAAAWSANEHSVCEDDLPAGDLDACRCAGYAAVIAAGHSEDDAAAGCDEDADECDFKRVRGDLAEAKSRAVALMRRQENVQAVKRLADELLLRRQLHGDHVALLIDLADGEISEKEYLQLLVFRGWNHDGPTLEGEGY
jgi:hypothetical protein